MMMTAVGLKDRKNFRLKYVNPALTDGALEMRYPNEPNHSNQMYRLTAKAKKWLDGGYELS